MKSELKEIAEAIPTLDELALLDEIAYDQVRQKIATQMGIRVSVLDKQVYSKRPRARADRNDVFESPEPWPEEVDLSALLDEVAAAIIRHVVLERQCAVAIALYVILTYCIDEISCCPNLGLESPEKRCGKTTLIDLLTRLVYRPTPAANISTATIYRLIDAIRPTLLLDEADTFLKAIPEMIGILNSGHQRASAFVWRTVEVQNVWEPQKFSTWAPKIIAQIGRLPDTLRDRSVIISMRRKLTNERVVRLRKCEYSHLQRQAHSWALDNAHLISSMEPEIPEGLNDREADSWEPLIAIADLAGNHWPEAARVAATALCGASSDTDSIRIQLLTDIRTILDDSTLPGCPTNDLLLKLCEFEDHPWPTYSKGKPINARQLAALLKPFEIKPGVQHKLGQKRGYLEKDFQDVFERYLPPLSEMPLDPHEISEIQGNTSVRSNEVITDENTSKPLIERETNGITHELGNQPEDHLHIEVQGEINQGEDSWIL